MPEARSTRAATRGRGRGRHGRGFRASVTGPFLPPLRTRLELFDMTVASAAGYLKDMWPEDLAATQFEIADMPTHASHGAIARWSVHPTQNRIVLYRLPIERLAKLHHRDELHRRMLVESCVFRAVAEFLGKDPWDLAPDDFPRF